MGLDLKRLLLILADTNHDGKLNLHDLPGVLARANRVKDEVEELKETLKDFAAAGNLTSDGKHVSPEQLTQLLAELEHEAITLRDKSAASAAAIKAETGIGGGQ